MAHSVLGASAAHRWIPCPGSIAMCADIPNESSEFALEGSAAHAVAACILDGIPVAAGMVYLANEDMIFHPDAGILTETFSPLVEVDEDMIEHAQAYADYCLSIPGKHLTEVRVSYEEYVPQGFGTSDHIVIGKGVMDVIDLKYGKGVRVYSERNEQGLLYALGAYLNFRFIYDDIETIRVHIYQPRLDHVSVAEYPLDEVLAFAEIAGIAGKLAMEPGAPLVPGDKQCRFCPAKAVCPARAEQSLRTACEEFGTFDDALNTLVVDPDLLPVKSTRKLDSTDISLLLTKVNDIEDWCAAIRSKAHAMLFSGEDVPGWKLVEGRSLRQWADETQAAKVLMGLGFEEVEIFKTALLSPAQAEKLVGKKVAPSLEFAITKPEGKPSLATADDPRPALCFTGGREFSDETPETV